MSESATREPARGDLGPLNICDTCVAWSTYAVANSGAVTNKPVLRTGWRCSDLIQVGSAEFF